MIDRFEIKNFKMFDELTINHLAPITLIGGKNNVGKSGLIEGLFVATKRENPNLFPMLFSKRGLAQVENSARGLWFPYFHNFDESKIIEFFVFAVDKKQTEHIKISYEKVVDNVYFIKQDGRFIPTEGNVPTDKHVLKIEVNGQKFEHLISKGLTAFGDFPPTSHDTLILGSAFMPSANMITQIAEVDKKNLISELIKFIQIVEPSVSDISVSPQGILLDCGFKEKIDTSLSGEGTMRFLSIASVVIAAEPEILLIDEIENGIHYSVLPKFWEALSTLCHEKNVQLIAATHSKECIEAAAQVMADKPEEDFAFIRLQRDQNEKIVAVEMTAAGVCRMAQRDWEIR